MSTEEIKSIAQTINRTQRKRTLSDADVVRFIELFEAHKDNLEVHTIRVYSGQGFVPNAYKYRAGICLLEATRNAETHAWNISGRVVDAKRSHGKGSLTTINGRAA